MKSIDNKLSVFNYTNKRFGAEGVKGGEGLITITMMVVFLSVTFSAMDYSIPVGVNIISVLAGVTAVLSMVTSTKGTKGQGVFGGLNVIFYGIMSIYSAFGGEVILNLVFFLPLTAFIGISGRADKKDDKLQVRKLEVRTLIGLFLMLAAFTGGMGYGLSTTGDPAPYLDAMSSVISVVGMFLMISKHKENGYGGFMVNIVSVIMGSVALAQGDPLAASAVTTGSIYLFNSILGMIVGRYKSKQKEQVTLKEEYEPFLEEGSVIKHYGGLEGKVQTKRFIVSIKSINKEDKYKYIDETMSSWYYERYKLKLLT